MNTTRYFRVGAFHKSEKKKSIVVQCYNREEAEEWVPAVKAMLYPGESTDGFVVGIHEFKLQINLNRLNHYRITVERPVDTQFDSAEEEMEYDNQSSFDTIVEADNEEEARKSFLCEWFKRLSGGKAPDEYDIYVDEIPLDEMIKRKEKQLRQKLIGGYIIDKYGDISVREYCRLLQGGSEAEQNELFCKALAEHLRRIRTIEFVEKIVDSEKLSHAEFKRIVNGFLNDEFGTEFRAMYSAVKEKYGKEEEKI